MAPRALPLNCLCGDTLTQSLTAILRPSNPHTESVLITWWRDPTRTVRGPSSSLLMSRGVKTTRFAAEMFVNLMRWLPGPLRRQSMGSHRCTVPAFSRLPRPGSELHLAPGFQRETEDLTWFLSTLKQFSKFQASHAALTPPLPLLVFPNGNEP